MSQYPQHMKMSELSARAKIPVDTIRNYARKGLLPKPIKTGKTMAYYTVEHIDRLRKIHVLQKKGHSLDEIRGSLNQTSSDTPSGLQPGTLYTSKRTAIIKAALELFRDKGYQTTNIDDIVTHAGIGKSTFYQYFRSMEYLFFECSRHTFLDFTKNYFSVHEADDGLSRLWHRGHTFMRTHRYMIDLFNLVRGAFMKDSNRIRKTLEEDIMHDLTKAIETDLVAASRKENIHFTDLHLLAYLFMGATEYVYYYFKLHPETGIDIIYMKSWDIVFNVNGHYTGPEVGELMNYPAAIAACSEKLIQSELGDEDLMKISELSRRSGIPVSTIRYYILEGLLPEAIKTGKTRAYYGGTHLKALDLIRRKQVDEKKQLNRIREEIEQEVSLPENHVKQAAVQSDKRDDILSVSTELFLTKGYIETSTSDIAHQAKMSKETVYRHFRNKEEILMACADRVFHNLYDHVRAEISEEKDAALRLIKRGKVFFSLYPQWVPMMNLMRSLSVGDNPSFRTKFNQLIWQMVKPTIREIENLKQEERIRKDIDSDLAGFILVGMCEYGAWLIQREQYSEVTIMQSLTSILYEGVIVGPS
jgi:AcrR family transcriptional regulator